MRVLGKSAKVNLGTVTPSIVSLGKVAAGPRMMIGKPFWSSLTTSYSQTGLQLIRISPLLQDH